MTISHSGEQTPRKPLRLWPGVVVMVLQLLVMFVVPLVVPDAGGISTLGGLAGALIVLLWWLFFSRAPWSERLGAIAFMAVVVLATLPVLHQSIRTGMMGLMFIVYVIPVLGFALVAWAVAGRRLTGTPRLASMAAAILLACGAFTLLRTEGITGDAQPDFEWRWTPTAEERLLAQATDEPAMRPSASPPAATPDIRLPARAADAAATAGTNPAPAPSSERPDPPPAGDKPGAKTDAVWPGFRGPRRDSVIDGVRIETDWSRTPPAEIWRRPIGPGWSSFAVRGDLVYTQEQRGDDEIVSCYRLSTGDPVWRHRDPVRFWESNGGAGPRATPTVHNGRVYTFGATGIVNALDAGSGAVAWSRNAATDTGAPLPGWGFAGSPVVVDDLVIVAASGRLIGYEIATGKPRWIRTTGGGGYSSPHFVTIDGVDDLLMAGGDMMGGVGMRRLAVSQAPGGWSLEERWTTRGLKPYFNDFVVHKGHAFGFDGSILACIELENGERKWKGGRYGHGQMVLLPDQDLLLVLSEEGELALVSATGGKFAEVARFKAIEGKTWNHPVVVGNVLLVRNGEEMAAFRVALAGSDF